MKQRVTQNTYFCNHSLGHMLGAKINKALFCLEDFGSILSS